MVATETKDDKAANKALALPGFIDGARVAYGQYCNLMEVKKMSDLVLYIASCSETPRRSSSPSHPAKDSLP